MDNYILSSEDRRKLEEALRESIDNFPANTRHRAALSLLAGLAKVQDEDAKLDFRDVINNPTKYLVDGRQVLSAQLQVNALRHTIMVHAHDYGLQEKRITHAAIKEHPQP